MGAISINRYSGWQREYKVGPKLHFLEAIFPHSLNPGNHFPTFFKWFYQPKDSQPSGDATQQHIKCCLQENTKLGWCWKPKPMLQTKCEGVKMQPWTTNYLLSCHCDQILVTPIQSDRLQYSRNTYPLTTGNLINNGGQYKIISSSSSSYSSSRTIGQTSY